ncbi:hypothetical protein ESCO_003253 [Escovopsis weberi]|uniref:2EXR domain-containing protein n=1 Tax=Escovopsis weberi TaxID=150374 RepID=A0A0N0RT80_ESCWE|nr:hypothetical protein ESCO_003253 [Escovopsis weberi]
MTLPDVKTIFSCLPTEIRLRIWDLLEPPRRVIALVPCSNCGLFPASNLPNENITSRERRRCKETTHPDWDFKYIVHPRSCAVFAPLHVCRESREMWLPRFRRAPRYCRSTPTTLRVRFTVPFIDYDRDIFAVLEVLVAYQNKNTWRPKPEILADQAFVGLDRNLIRFVGMRDNVAVAWNLISLIPFHSLPAMESLTLITLGPVPRQLEPEPEPGPNAPPPQWHEMSPTQSRYFECHLRDLWSHPTAEWWDNNHFIVNRWRPKAFASTRRDDPPVPLDDSLTVIEAMLWHYFRLPKGRPMTPAQRARGMVMAPSLHRFVMKADIEYSFSTLEHVRLDCPFMLTRCGPGGHTRRSMLRWRRPFKILAMYLCETEWLATLDSFNVFADSTTEQEDMALKVYLKNRYRLPWNIAH